MCKSSGSFPPRFGGRTRVCSALILCGLTAASDAQVFGLVIGEEVRLPECTRLVMPAVKNFEPPYAPISTTCTMSRGAGGSIAFPPSAPPRHMAGNQIGYRLVDGKLDVLFGTTAGAPVQDAVMADLQAKFGPPVHRVDETVTTTAGAALRSVRAHWALPSSRIEYLGIAGRADAGELVVGTPDGIARFREEQRRATAGRSTPM